MSERLTFYGKGNPIMELAFRGCVAWAWENQEIRQTFEEETGYLPPKILMDAWLDEETGYQDKRVDAFIHWVRANVWGEEEE